MPHGGSHGGGFLADFLEDNPNLLFQGLRPRGPSRTFSEFFRQRQPEIENRFLGGLGRTALSGQVPTQTFQDFLRNFDFRADFLSRSPRARGENRSLLAPRLLWNI